MKRNICFKMGDNGGHRGLLGPMAPLQGNLMLSGSLTHRSAKSWGWPDRAPFSGASDRRGFPPYEFPLLLHTPKHFPEFRFDPVCALRPSPEQPADHAPCPLNERVGVLTNQHRRGNPKIVGAHLNALSVPLLLQSTPDSIQHLPGPKGLGHPHDALPFRSSPQGCMVT
jgi:hypothetical protein